jgi:hypothetical protein
MVACTRSSVSTVMDSSRPLRTLETVVTDTPAAWATSLIVTRLVAFDEALDTFVPPEKLGFYRCNVTV